MMFAVIDIETTGLNRYKDKINVCGVYIPDYNYYAQPTRSSELTKLLNSLPEKPHMIWANGKFDTLFLEEQWKIPKDMLTIDDDIMIMAYVLEMGQRKGLKELAKRHCGAEDWDVDKKTKLGMSEEMLNYNKLDLYWTWQVYQALLPKFDERTWKLYKGLALESFKAYRNVERRGMYIDVDGIKALIPQYKAKAAEIEAELKQVANINWNSNAQVAKVFIDQLGMPVLKRTPKGAVSIGAEQLEDYAAMGYPIATKLLEYKRRTKDVGTFLEPWLEQAVNSRLHPSFNVDTVRTGRTSCQEPNLQQVPRDKALRTLFKAPPGKALFECDYSQLELRIACHYAEERTMQHIYAEQGDIHTRTAQVVTGKQEVTKEERGKAKAVNFGFLYGMSAKGFVNYAKTGYGVHVTDKEATEMRARYFNTYRDLEPWYTKQKRLCVQDGGVYTLFGRFRALPEIYSQEWSEKGSAERCCINTPVQSSGSDILLSAMIEIDQTLPECEIVCTVHDSILVEVPELKIDYYKERIGNIMKHPALLDYFGVQLKVPLDIDIGVGPWGTH
jgi:DNA polymerase-1